MKNSVSPNSQGGVTPQCSVLKPTTAVKYKVKSQEAKIIKVKGQAWSQESKAVPTVYFQDYMWISKLMYL